METAATYTVGNPEIKLMKAVFANGEYTPEFNLENWTEASFQD